MLISWLTNKLGKPNAFPGRLRQFISIGDRLQLAFLMILLTTVSDQGGSQVKIEKGNV